MPRRYFSADEVLPDVRKHTVQALFFAMNHVKIFVHVSVDTNTSSFLVEYIDRETKAESRKTFYHIEQALDFAEDVQVVG